MSGPNAVDVGDRLKCRKDGVFLAVWRREPDGGFTLRCPTCYTLWGWERV